MKKVLLATTMLGLMAGGMAHAGAGDSGVPIVDGLTNGMDAQAKMMEEMGPMAILVMPFMPLFLAGGVLVDTGEKLTGN
ncbi:MAG: hypothetical protein V4668_03795 [Patescibacteria group bacterium]